MSTIPLRVILHGLIALAPTTDIDGRHHMTALLVDGSMPHAVEDACAMIHRPQLRFLVAETRQCNRDGCSFSGNQCTCTAAALKRKKISLKMTPEPAYATQRLSSEIPSGLPASRSEAGLFGYIANLSQAPFGLTLDQETLTDSPPEHLLARMDVPFGNFTACSLSIREDAGRENVHEMSFRKLNDPPLADDVSYALAQRVISEITIPEGAEQKVVLEISDFDGANKREFLLLATGNGYEIVLSNQPQAPLDRDDPCNDGIARHFAKYYMLAKDPPPHPLLPHVRPTQWKAKRGSRPEEDLVPEICNRPHLGMMDRPICPISSFNP